MSAVNQLVDVAVRVYTTLQAMHSSDARGRALAVRVAVFVAVLRAAEAAAAATPTPTVDFLRVVGESRKTLYDAAALAATLSAASGSFFSRIVVSATSMFRASATQSQLDALESRLAGHVADFAAMQIVATRDGVAALAELTASMSDAQREAFDRLVDVRDVARHTAGDIAALSAGVDSALVAVERHGPATEALAEDLRGVAATVEQCTRDILAASSRGADDVDAVSVRLGELQRELRPALSAVASHAAAAAAAQQVQPHNDEVQELLSAVAERCPAWAGAVDAAGVAARRYADLRDDAAIAAAAAAAGAGGTPGDSDGDERARVARLLASMLAGAAPAAPTSTVASSAVACDELASAVCGSPRALAALESLRGVRVLVAYLRARMQGTRAPVKACLSALLCAVGRPAGAAVFRTTGGHAVLVDVLAQHGSDAAVADRACRLADCVTVDAASAHALAVCGGAPALLRVVTAYGGDSAHTEWCERGHVALARVEEALLSAASSNVTAAAQAAQQLPLPAPLASAPPAVDVPPAAATTAASGSRRGGSGGAVSSGGGGGTAAHPATAEDGGDDDPTAMAPVLRSGAAATAASLPPSAPPVDTYPQSLAYVGATVAPGDGVPPKEADISSVGGGGGVGSGGSLRRGVVEEDGPPAERQRPAPAAMAATAPAAVPAGVGELIAAAKAGSPEAALAALARGAHVDERGAPNTGKWRRRSRDGDSSSGARVSMGGGAVLRTAPTPLFVQPPPSTPPHPPPPHAQPSLAGRPSWSPRGAATTPSCGCCWPRAPVKTQRTRCMDGAAGGARALGTSWADVRNPNRPDNCQPQRSPSFPRAGGLNAANVRLQRRPRRRRANAVGCRRKPRGPQQRELR
jgi:hypothetical protein